MLDAEYLYFILGLFQYHKTSYGFVIDEEEAG